jgi:hypothetical protein
VNQRELYEDAVRRLLACDYEVFSDESGYRVQHRTDELDISVMRDVSDLVDFANLMDWVEQRQNLRGGGIWLWKAKNPHRIISPSGHCSAFSCSSTITSPRPSPLVV